MYEYLNIWFCVTFNTFVSFQIREDWKYVAMVIDRLQLYIFFAVTTAGTIGILLDAPHIFQYVDQDKIIEIHKGKPTWVEITFLYFIPKRKKKESARPQCCSSDIRVLHRMVKDRKKGSFIQVDSIVGIGLRTDNYTI